MKIISKTNVVEEIRDKRIWEDFLSACQEKTFLQSWNWGEFQERMGNKIWRLAISDDRLGLSSTALVVKIMAKRGTFLLVQHGPNILNHKSEILNPKQIQNYKFQTLNALLDKLRKIGEEEKADFIRVAPILEDNEENKKIFQDLGFRKSPMHANAYEATWKLDITVSEGELLENMRKTTRYLIRQAMKNPDITIEKSEKLEDLETYQKLNQEVARRQKFTPFSHEYIKNEFEIFSKNNQSSLFLGKYKDKIVSGALIIFWSGAGFYHQAASDARYSRLSIPYLLQWEAIKEAKRRGCVLYDFWGFTDPQKYPKHPWAGPTLFKMGFGGGVYEYVKTQDFPLSKKYWLTYMFEMLRKVKRGL